MSRPTEIRTYHDMQQQIELERMLAARHARDAAREARFRTLPTPQQPELVQMCAVVEAGSEPMFTRAEPMFTRAEAVILALISGASVGIFVASVMGWLP